LFYFNRTVFWDVTPLNLIQVYGCFGEGIAFIFRIKELARQTNTVGIENGYGLVFESLPVGTGQSFPVGKAAGA
jgi:hypothetical protein